MYAVINNKSFSIMCQVTWQFCCHAGQSCFIQSLIAYDPVSGTHIQNELNHTPDHQYFFCRLPGPCNFRNKLTSHPEGNESGRVKLHSSQDAQVMTYCTNVEGGTSTTKHSLITTTGTRFNNGAQCYQALKSSTSTCTSRSFFCS